MMAIWTWIGRLALAFVALVALPLFYRQESIAADDALLGTDTNRKDAIAGKPAGDKIKPFAIVFALCASVAVFYVPWSQADDGNEWISLQGMQASAITPDGIGTDPRHQRTLKAIVTELKARLENQPEDVGAWLLLGRTLRIMDKQWEAVHALQEAHQRAPEHPDVIALLAETRYTANGGNMDSMTRRLLATLHARQPHNRDGLNLQARISYEQGDYQDAVSKWERLLASSALPEDERIPMEFSLASARLHAGWQMAGGGPGKHME